MDGRDGHIVGCAIVVDDDVLMSQQCVAVAEVAEREK